MNKLNPKKNRAVRRKRNSLGTYIPYVLRNMGKFRTNFNNKNNPQRQININLIKRAIEAKKTNPSFYNILIRNSLT